jgi:nucleoside-diphosphate-sugar epimerase
MRVLVVGASGAIGIRLVPQLIDRGHQVIGTFLSPRKADLLRALGAEPVALDLLDSAAVKRVVLGTRPDGIINEATALAGRGFSRKLDRTFEMTNRLRTEGTDALLAAAADVGVGRIVAQSFAPYRYARDGAMVKTEADLLDPDPPAGARQTNSAMAHLDAAVTEVGGIALRYGGFYGHPDDQLVRMVRKRRFPMIGDGEGVTSWIHLDDAAAATILALEHGGAGIYNIVDDEPAATREWLPALAHALGAKPPHRIPARLAQLFAGEDVVLGATQSRGASNAKAKRELGWTLRHPSWREGFITAFGPSATRQAAPPSDQEPGAPARANTPRSDGKPAPNLGGATSVQ